jgi:hypothetical protein
VETTVEKDTRKMRKHRAQSQKVAGPNIDVLAYGSGVGHIRSSTALIWLVSIYALLFIVLLVLVGVLLYPGLLFLVVVVALVQPRRAIAVTPLGLLVMSESLMDGKPKRILFGVPLEELTNVDPPGKPKRSRGVRVQVGPERVRMKRSDYGALVTAARTADGSVSDRGHPGP